MTLVLCGIKYSFATACNVLLSFCFCLKSWCFCLQGTRHTFHAQKAREKEKVSQKMWKNWTTWSSNQHNRSENKKWAEPMGQQSVTPKKAKKPSICRTLVFDHPPKPQIRRLQTIPLASPNSTGVVQKWRENLIQQPYEPRKHSQCILPQEAEEMLLGDSNMCSKLSNWAV